MQPHINLLLANLRASLCDAVDSSHLRFDLRFENINLETKNLFSPISEAARA